MRHFCERSPTISRLSAETLIERASPRDLAAQCSLRGRTRPDMLASLRMFADLLDEGSWVDARIDHAIPDRQPMPKPDIRSMLRPLGPVAVFVRATSLSPIRSRAATRRRHSRLAVQ